MSNQIIQFVHVQPNDVATMAELCGRYPPEFYVLTHAYCDTEDAYGMKQALRLHDDKIHDHIKQWKTDYPMFDKLVIGHHGEGKWLPTKTTNNGKDTKGIFITSLFSATMFFIGQSTALYFDGQRWID